MIAASTKHLNSTLREKPKMSSGRPPPDRDHGASWRDRLAEARKRSVDHSQPLSGKEIAELDHAAASLDVSSPQDCALFWSGKDILTHVPLDENLEGGPKWWDKLAPLDARIFRELGLGVTVEDTPCGQYILGLGLNFSPDDPLAVVQRKAWDVVSVRFAEAARGRVEILVEGAWEEGVFRSVEFGALLTNRKVTCINGLDRLLLPQRAEDAFPIMRRWNVERSRLYLEFLNTAPDATPHERATAFDDHREVQLFFEQDFFTRLGPNRELPALPPAVLAATDRTRDVGAWKYSAVWRALVRSGAPA